MQALVLCCHEYASLQSSIHFYPDLHFDREGMVAAYVPPSQKLRVEATYEQFEDMFPLSSVV